VHRVLSLRGLALLPLCVVAACGGWVGGGPSEDDSGEQFSYGEDGGAEWGVGESESAEEGESDYPSGPEDGWGPDLSSTGGTSEDGGDEGGCEQDPDAAACFAFGGTNAPEVLWQRLEPGRGSWRGVVAGPDGTVYVSGNAGEDGSHRQLIAYTDCGEELWSLGNENDNAYGIAWAGDKLIVGGESHFGVTDHPDWLRAYSPEGELLWEIEDELGDLIFRDVAVGLEGEILVAGRHWDSPGDLRAILFEPDGSIRWVHDSGTTETGGSSAPEVTFDAQGRPYVAFRFEPPETRHVLRFDENGELTLSFDLSAPDLPLGAWPNDIHAADALYVAGRADNRAWVGRFGENGSAEWTREYGAQTWDQAQAVLAVDDGVVIGGQLNNGLTGCSSQCREAWAVRLGADGSDRWQLEAAGAALRNDQVLAIAEAPDGDLILVGDFQCEVPEEDWENTPQAFVVRVRGE
jgi:hypothetical protein